MRTHHQIIDLNQDGIVSWDDFQVLITRFSKVGNFSPVELDRFINALKVS